MVAGSMRHFKSLRSLERDHGWIHTLLEEAENERMHLLTFLHMFKAGPVTRGFIIGAQGILVGGAYLLHFICFKSHSVNADTSTPMVRREKQKSAIPTAMALASVMTTAATTLNRVEGCLSLPGVPELVGGGAVDGQQGVFASVQEVAKVPHIVAICQTRRAQVVIEVAKISKMFAKIGDLATTLAKMLGF
jgi:hypothetical protein